jgi:hypothetical protein
MKGLRNVLALVLIGLSIGQVVGMERNDLLRMRSNREDVQSMESNLKSTSNDRDRLLSKHQEFEEAFKGLDDEFLNAFFMRDLQLSLLTDPPGKALN